jgi:hypothetical protein
MHLMSWILGKKSSPNLSSTSPARSYLSIMAFPGEAPDDPRWEDLLAHLGLEYYYDRLLDAAIDDPKALGSMVHGDAMDILKELDVAPGHRHRLLLACVDSMRTSELAMPWKVDAF